MFSENRKKILRKIKRKSVVMRQLVSRRVGLIVGSEYCVPHGVGFRIEPKYLYFDKYILNVSDDKGKINWEIKMYDPPRHNNKFMVHDNEGKIIMTLQESRIASEILVRPRWKVYKGDSTDEKDFLFTVKRPWVFWKCDLEVYLPSTKEENGGFDFQVVANWLNKDIVVKEKGGRTLADGYMGWDWLGAAWYNVTVSPNVDYAFIVALALIFYNTSTGGAADRLDDPDGLDDPDDFSD